MDPAPVLTEADVCRKITTATQLLTERRKLHDLATQAITKQQILMDAGLVTAKTIKASAATIKKAAEAVSDAENQINILDENNESALHYCSFWKCYPCRIAFKRGADVDTPQCPTSPLYVACIFDIIECVEILLDYGVN
ncbi:hypothetical protein CDAR_413231, partial [Caerostris darwini]